MRNHMASVLMRHEGQIEDYQARLNTLDADLRLAISNVTAKVRDLFIKGVGQELPISA